MPKIKYDRLPHAGEFEKESGTEILYLSPKPIPTGMPAFSARQLHRNANNVFLDFAVGQGSFEFMVRIGIGSIMLIITLLFFFSGFASYIRRNAEPFLSGWLSFFFQPGYLDNYHRGSTDVSLLFCADRPTGLHTPTCSF